ncbi:MAG TPA: hypothetical protein VGY66_36400 [Gemmataceae bacterium]|jgi:hypothetical protein|nr:hypothetical protein [Gemmataceae bacterium]
MKKVDDIVAAAERLDARDFIRLRQKLDQLEKKRWRTELARATKEFRAAKLTDEKIDELVLKRRYEGRR